MWRDGQKATEPRHITDAITDEAVRFVDERAAADGPFYLQVHYTAPHSPRVDQHPERYTRLYQDCEFASCPQGEPHPWFGWEPGPVSDAMRDPRPSLIGYFASLTGMDDGVGRIERHGLRSSTVVVFLSDNGFSCGHHGVWGKGNATWPLNMWEDSVKTPALIRQPGRLPSGAVRRDLVSACDLHPTLLDLAGCAVPEDPLAAGRSLAPTLERGQPASRESVLVFDEYGGARMARTQRWKYVARVDGPAELYDLDGDPGELVNRVDDRTCRGRVDELGGLLHDWFARHSVPELDAFHRPVSGRGQTAPIWKGLGNERTYHLGAGEMRTAPDPAGEHVVPPGGPI